MEWVELLKGAGGLLLSGVVAAVISQAISTRSAWRTARLSAATQRSVARTNRQAQEAIANINAQNQRALAEDGRRWEYRKQLVAKFREYVNTRGEMYVRIFAEARADNTAGVQAILARFDRDDGVYASDLTRREVELQSEAFRIAVKVFEDIDKEFKFRCLSALKRNTLNDLADHLRGGMIRELSLAVVNVLVASSAFILGEKKVRLQPVGNRLTPEMSTTTPPSNLPATDAE